MEKHDIEWKTLPDNPGVYIFRGARRAILYVGKATSLRERVRSYFSNDLIEARGPRMVKAITDAKSLELIETDSVLEALILEANLIKRYQPWGNVRDKDDKSYNYAAITDEAYPRVLLVRGRELERNAAAFSIKHLFGPFPQGGALKEALRIIRKIFPYFDTKRPVEEMQKAGRLSFNQEIGIYPGVPGSLPEKSEYRRTIRHIVLFFQGKKKVLLSELERQMKKAAKAEEFERAGELKRQIFALTHIHDVSLIQEELREPGGGKSMRIEAYDVAHISGSEAVGVMTVIEGGEPQKSDYRKFKLTKDVNNDVLGLKEVLLRRLGHPEWPLPRLIVVDGGKAQVNAAKSVLFENGYGIPIVGVVKDEHHRPKELIGDEKLRKEHEVAIVRANAEAHRFALSYHQKRRRIH